LLIKTVNSASLAAMKKVSPLVVLSVFMLSLSFSPAQAGLGGVSGGGGAGGGPDLMYPNGSAGPAYLFCPLEQKFVLVPAELIKKLKRLDSPYQEIHSKLCNMFLGE
jgi:hypothetical protein